jgi:hypothetical protein
MDDDHTPDGNSDASSEDFHDIAKTAGAKMKPALQEIRNRTSDNEGYIMFEIRDHKEILQKTVETFEHRVSRSDKGYGQNVAAQ